MEEGKKVSGKQVSIHPRPPNEPSNNQEQGRSRQIVTYSVVQGGEDRQTGVHTRTGVHTQTEYTHGQECTHGQDRGPEVK